MHNDEILQVVDDAIAANGGSVEWSALMDSFEYQWRQQAVKVIGAERAAGRLVKTVTVDRETGQSQVTISRPAQPQAQAGGVTNG